MTTKGGRPIFTAGLARVALMVDNPLRDLPAMVLLAYHLADKGIACFLVPHNLRERELWHLVPDLVVVNYVRPLNEKLVGDLLASGMKVVVLETEGGVFRRLPDKVLELAAETKGISLPPEASSYGLFLLKTPSDARVRTSLTGYLSWAEEFSQFLRRQQLFGETPIVTTGSPRMDLYHATWRELALATCTAPSEIRHPFVLINSNFSLANPKFLLPEQELQGRRRVLELGEEFMRSMQRAQSAAMQAMTALVNELVCRLPHVDFVYRPHPFEGKGAYDELLDEAENLHVIQDGVVTPWLIHASALIHWRCTTAIEYAMLNKTAFIPGWIPAPVDVPETVAVSHVCANIDDMEEAIRKATAGDDITGGARRSEQRRVIERVFGPSDGRACERVVDALLDILGRGSQRLDVQGCARRVYGTMSRGKSLSQRLAARLRHVLGLSVHFSLRSFRQHFERHLAWDESPKRFDVDQVQQLIKAIERTLSVTNRVCSAAALDSDAYRFGYREGRSVVVAPVKNTLAPSSRDEEELHRR